MYPNPPSPPRRRRRWPIVLAAVAGGLVLLCVGFALLALALGSKAPSTASSAGGDGAAGPAVAGVGQPARDGKFEFTVTKVQCGVPSVGTELFNRKAQGQYCLVSVTVANIGAEPRTLAADNQHAYNSAGARYDADSAASIYLDDAGRALYEPINPGNKVNGTLIFDIPAGASLAKLELHDSPLSGGVTVSLAAAG